MVRRNGLLRDVIFAGAGGKNAAKLRTTTDRSKVRSRSRAEMINEFVKGTFEKMKRRAEDRKA